MKRIFKKRYFHLYAMGVWGLLLIPTLLWWRESILWVAFMSLYANFSAHWSAYQAKQAEKQAEKSE